jgi:hypothetical protein
VQAGDTVGLTVDGRAAHLFSADGTSHHGEVR